MIWCYIISLPLFILCIILFKSTKESDSYYYEEESAEYWKLPLWVLLLIIFAWTIPYANLATSIVILIIQVSMVAAEDCLKIVPRENTFFGKVLKFLTKEI
jgi:hypothetical protein